LEEYLVCADDGGRSQNELRIEKNWIGSKEKREREREMMKYSWKYYLKRMGWT